VANALILVDDCVKNSALAALRAGFAVRVDPSAVRGVEVEAGDSERASQALRAAGATVA
jgi:nicotinamidase/pyrazinamidase